MAVKKGNLIQIKDQEYYLETDENGNPLTGEVKKVDVVIREVPRTGFSITYLSAIVQMIDSIGNKKLQVVKYILQKMDSNNKLVETVREIAKGCNCAIQTVNDTLKLLENVGIIARKTGCVMLSPKLIHKGNAQKERILMTKFLEIKDGSADEISNTIEMTGTEVTEYRFND